MRIKILRINLLLALALLTQSFGGGANPNEIFAHFAAAIKNKSGIQYYAVITVADLTQGTRREVCAAGNQIRSALHKELKYDYDNQSVAMVEHMALMNLDRFFEFKNPEAIALLGTDAYTEQDVLDLEKTVDFNKLAKQIRGWGVWQMEFKDDDKQMLLYAHCLFNRGLLTGEDKDHLGTLVYVAL
jgi:hypothetical protein